MNVGLTQDERLARLRLIRSEGIGPITFKRFLSRYGTAQKALGVLITQKPDGVMTVQEAENELKMLTDLGGMAVIYGDSAYPEQLAMIDDFPPVLHCLGDVSLLSKSCVGIVGARNASANARRLTQTLARDLGAQGQVIVSGLARGIDTAAHEASLDTGTIAVLAGGVDEVYPTENTALYKSIIEKGCIVSEMPVGTKPTAHHFPRRNRIVAGLSKGVVVVEATLKSGSLITARLAGEQGREVFAVPGFPGDPRSAGPNALIQNGAKLITCAEDILSELIYAESKAIDQQSLFAEAVDAPEIQEVYGLQDRVIETLSHTPLEIDEIVRLSGAQAHEVQSLLLELEVSGAVQRHPGNRISKVA